MAEPRTRSSPDDVASPSVTPVPPTVVTALFWTITDPCPPAAPTDSPPLAVSVDADVALTPSIVSVDVAADAAVPTLTDVAVMLDANLELRAPAPLTFRISGFMVIGLPAVPNVSAPPLTDVELSVQTFWLPVLLRSVTDPADTAIDPAVTVAVNVTGYVLDALKNAASAVLAGAPVDGLQLATVENAPPAAEMAVQV